MKTAEIRTKFLEFFNSKGHEIVASSSLVPENDPTLLFSNAGMNQFKDLFLGAEKRSYSRATTSQKCMRISGKHNDLENVGVTARHHTFFEMLGNFSFGDYFKKDAISFAWEFVTEIVKLDKQKLWITIYKDDDEAKDLWIEVAGVDPERIIKLGEKDNFWMMGDTGPCGPCSEIHYYIGNDPENQTKEEFLKDDGTYLEFWNLVFMQYNRSADGKMEPLPKPSVDTGMGLERIASIKQGLKSNYDIDVLKSVIKCCEKLSGCKYDGSSFEVKNLKEDQQYAQDVAMRVIADHSRAMAFSIADGVRPGSDGRAYVLRRIIRRAIRHGRNLNFKENFLKHTTQAVIDTMGEHYPELKASTADILEIVDQEETKFYETLDTGLGVLKKEAEKLKAGELFSGKTAFLLHDTYGFPLDLTEDALKAYELQVDKSDFDQAMEEQKSRSRADRESRSISYSSVTINSKPGKFVGYEEQEIESDLNEIVNLDDELVGLVFKETPFYAESGGQVGDTGTIQFKDVNLEVIDTQKVQNQHHLHYCKVTNGKFSDKLVSEKASLKIDIARREAIRNNHSATHIVHAALRKFLGDHVKQAGSRVDDLSLRFDYSHFKALSADQLQEINEWANEEVRNNYEVKTQVLGIEEAKKTGAVALFGEKYGDKVRVVEIGPNSLEFCGGTHVTRSGDIGFINIVSESSIASGVRRIECSAGNSAVKNYLEQEKHLSELASLLKSDTANLPDKVSKLLDKVKELENDLSKFKSKLAASSSDDLVKKVKTSPSGLKVITDVVPNADVNTLRDMVDNLRNKLGSGIVVLGSPKNGSATLVAGITKDLTKKSIHAGKLVQNAIKNTAGKGGGRPDFAQAGGIEADKLDQALNDFFSLID